MSLRRHAMDIRQAVRLVPLVVAMALAAGALRADVRDERWRQDLATLASQLVSRHPNPFFKVRKADFDDAVAELHAAVPTLADSEVVVGFMRITALIGDGHTQIFLLENAGPQGMRFFPWQLYWFDEGLYVIRTMPAAAAARGARVVSIGGMDPVAVERLVEKTISHENDFWVREKSPYHMISLEILQALKVLPAGGGGSFVLQDANGKRFRMDLEAVSTSAWATLYYARPDPTTNQLHLQHPELNYWYSYLESQRVLYFQYNACVDQPGRPFGAFTKELLSLIDSRPVDRMVLDLRYNGGGNSAIFIPLFEGLKSRGIFSGPGRASVVLGRGTFSSGLWHTLEMQAAGATALGEPTGGKPNSYGETLDFVLPNSGIRVRYSTRFWTRAPGDPIAQFPDVALPPRASDYFGGRDPAVDIVAAGDHAPTATVLEPTGDRSVEAGTEMAFSGVGTDPDAGDSLTYEWRFGDGGAAEGASVRHTFTLPGSYEVVLTVRDRYGAFSTASVQVTASEPSPNGAEVFLPVVLDVAGVGGSHYTTELTFVSRAPVPVTVSLLYTGSSGGGTGYVSERLAPGEVRIVPDAIAFLRSRGLPIAADGTGVLGTLRATFGGAASGDVSLGARTSTAGAGGTFGLFYSGARLSTSTATIVGLQESASVRSNLALQNGGSTPVTLRVRLFGPMGEDLGTLDDQPLGAYGFAQLDRPLLGRAMAGRAVVTRVSGTAPFHAYGVLNDAITSDGSFLPPVLPGDETGPDRLVPVVLDAKGLGGSHYTTELTLANLSSGPLDLLLVYTAALGSGSGGIRVTLAAGEQHVVPDAIAHLRAAGLSIPADGSAVAGSLLVRATGGSASFMAGARTSTPVGDAPGTFGIYYAGLTERESATTAAWVDGLRQDDAMRSNLAFVNRGDGGDAITLRVTYFGPNGAVLGTPDEVTLRPGEWAQRNQPLASRGAAVACAKVERVSGASRFVAYGVLNDAVTSDGSYIAMTKSE